MKNCKNSSLQPSGLVVDMHNEHEAQLKVYK